MATGFKSKNSESRCDRIGAVVLAPHACLALVGAGGRGRDFWSLALDAGVPENPASSNRTRRAGLNACGSVF